MAEENTTPEPDEVLQTIQAENPQPNAAPADTGTPATPAAMPEGGHEKFYDATTGNYNWQAHAVEAEFQRDQARQPSGQTPARAPEQTPAQTEQGEGENAAEKSAVEAAGLNWDDVRSTIEQHGNLTDAQYAAFEKIGIPPAVVEEHIQGLQTMGDLETQAIQTYVAEAMGLGPEGYETAVGELMDWATKNIPDGPEKDSLNETLASPNWRMAIDTLMVRRGTPPGSDEPGTLTGAAPDAGTGSAGGSVYESMEDMVNDQKKPEYDTNEKFRNAVLAKASRSPALNGGGRASTPAQGEGVGALRGGGIIVGA